MSSAYKFTSKSQLQSAVDLWCSDEVSATTTYGDINNWDVSSIKNFSYLFNDKKNFNSNISNWNVSSGTDFGAMFTNATSFNQDIGKWDVSSGTDFSFMF